MHGKASLQSTWEGMEDVYKQGLAKSIGISNYNAQSVMDITRYATVPPSVNQIEHHPYLLQPLLLNILKENNIVVTAYSSFGAQSYIELEHKQAKSTPPLFENPVIKKIAGAHNKTPAQVLLRWSTQRGIAVIPKSNNPQRLAQNLDVTDWDLTEDEIKEISGLDQGLRFNDYPDGVPLPVFS